LITLGVDAHKAIHVAVAVDEAGRELGEWRGPNTADGWTSLARWAADFGPDCWWGIEGAWGNGRGLAQHLVALGFTAFEVSPHWTTRLRRSNRRQGKSDRLDVRAVARCVCEEAPKLPLVHAGDDSVVLDLLSTEREAAVAEATRLRNQIHALLAQIDPQYGRRLPSLTSAAGLRAWQVTSRSIKHSSSSSGLPASVGWRSGFSSLRRRLRTWRAKSATSPGAITSR
jgi:transposase